MSLLAEGAIEGTQQWEHYVAIGALAAVVAYQERQKSILQRIIFKQARAIVPAEDETP